jgi:hypothetical protein
MPKITEKRLLVIGNAIDIKHIEYLHVVYTDNRLLILYEKGLVPATDLIIASGDNSFIWYRYLFISFNTYSQYNYGQLGVKKGNAFLFVLDFQ